MCRICTCWCEFYNMILPIKKYFGFGAKSPTSDFSAFFSTASRKEKEKFLKRVIRKANQDQKKIMEEAGKMKN